MNDYGLELIEKDIKSKLINELARTGLLFRLFSRMKDRYSIEEKFTRKDYSPETKLMQDFIGFRITTYFSDDLRIVIDLCEKIFGKIELIIDKVDPEIFKPIRMNMICRMPENERKTFNEIKNSNNQFQLIDDTFEIQFRTTLSEGWHEVEHLMRYKCKPDWIELTNESRMLNGIYANLETNDQALKALFDDISYHHYKAKKWEAMLRNKFRLRFLLQPLDDEIIKYLNENSDICREIFKVNRNHVISTYINSTLSFPITFNNWISFINHCFIKDDVIKSKTPDFLLADFELSFNESNDK